MRKDIAVKVGSAKMNLDVHCTRPKVTIYVYVLYKFWLDTNDEELI